MKEDSSKKGFAILSIAGVLSKILSLLYVPILTAIITEQGYGIYMQFYEIFTFVYVILNVGMQTAIAKYISELSAVGNHKSALRLFKITRNLLLILGIILTVLMVIMSKTMAELVSKPNAFYGYIALAPALAVTSILTAYRGLFQGKNMMSAIAVSQVLEQIINIITSVVFAYILMKESLILGCVGGTIGTTLGAIISVFYLTNVYRKSNISTELIKKHDENVEVTSNKNIIKTLFAYSFPITLSTGAQNLGAVIDMLTITKRLGAAGLTVSEADTKYGILSIYKSLIYVPMIIMVALAATIITSISKAIMIKDDSMIKENVNFAIKIVFIICIPAAIILTILSKETLIVFKGSSKGFELLLYGSFVLVFMAIVQVQASILQGGRDFYFVVKTMILGIVLKILSNYTFVAIPEININGAIIGGFLCFSIPMYLNHNRIIKRFRIRCSLIANSYAAIISGVVMGIVTLGSKIVFFNLATELHLTSRFLMIIPLSFVMVISGCTYLLMVIICGGIKKGEIEGISPKLYKIIPNPLRKIIRQ